ncbi:class I SAM-dependent methyltransferase [Fibrivirga algicola]|uniref:Methyltransferase domain-containing protein n=1 Tax=Fibrivirga algicola TaxID=2950420 RepID=A0ABX0QM61_9BACT|nr:methyltransferase domain-containing protein [Fibrivirga algicola]NID12366.1 methyltransferase domain-containing protein [Fibrivirga algicola]
MTFDPVAPFYDSLAALAFGKSLIRAQEWGVAQVRPGYRVLVLGGGSGVTLPGLLARHPTQVVYVEASAAMLLLAQQRVPPGAPVAFLLGTEADVPTSEPFDYILLPFVLDLYPAAALESDMLPTLLRVLQPAGQLIVTDFAKPTTYWQRVYMWLMLRFFRLTTGIPARHWTNWPASLAALGLVEQHGQSFRYGQLRSGCWLRQTYV